MDKDKKIEYLQRQNADLMAEVEELKRELQKQVESNNGKLVRDLEVLKAEYQNQIDIMKERNEQIMDYVAASSKMREQTKRVVENINILTAEKGKLFGIFKRGV